MVKFKYGTKHNTDTSNSYYGQIILFFSKQTHVSKSSLLPETLYCIQVGSSCQCDWCCVGGSIACSFKSRHEFLLLGCTRCVLEERQMLEGFPADLTGLQITQDSDCFFNQVKHTLYVSGRIANVYRVLYLRTVSRCD